MLETLRRRWFSLIHLKNLVYNQCWEDPRLDRVALQLTSADNVAVITSAGCNALDYVLAGAGRVNAIDVNPIQNALLELKVAGIRSLDHATFFQIFGEGHCPTWTDAYSQMRPHLEPTAQRYWDKNGPRFFASGRSFYFRGSSGMFAWMINAYMNRVAKIRGSVTRLLEAPTVQEQAIVYREERLRERLFRPVIRWFLRRDTTMAMLGVPASQRRQIDRDYPGGIAAFIMDRVETVFTRLPLSDNYFWRVYLTGQYTQDCCPEYLKAENFERLKAGEIDRLQVFTGSLLAFLLETEQPISRFVLLDHMDWLDENLRDALHAEWQGIVDRAAPGARVIWRSAGLKCEFVDRIPVRTAQGERTVGELLTYNRELADELHRQDRVNTYGTFTIADLP
jgi:S-adenosylmethionine-diacylglycerol 3-amino-3-carboxypropyl transferase